MYKAHQKKMYVAVFGLSIPLMFHAILDLLNLSAAYVKFKTDHSMIYNFVIFAFGYILPVGF